MNHQDPVEHLLQEHALILAQVDELQKAVDSVAGQGEDSLSNALPVFQRFGRMMATQLELHSRKEDDALFPELEAILGMGPGPTSAMREEHKQIHAQGVLLRETLHELNEVEHPAIEAGGAELRRLAGTGADAQALQRVGAEIADLLHMHFEKEEQVLFPMVRQLLEEDTLAKVATRFEEMTAESEAGE